MLKVDPRLLHEARSVSRWLITSVILGTLSSIPIVLSAYILSQIVSDVFLSGRNLHEVYPRILSILALQLLRAGLNWGSETMAAHAAGRIILSLRQRAATHVLALGPAYTYRERAGELSHTIMDGIEALDSYFRQYLPQIAKSSFIPIVILFFVFPLDALSGLVLLLTAPLIPIFMILIGDSAERLTRRQWGKLSSMSAKFLDVLQCLTTLKMLGRSCEQGESINEASDQFRHLTMRVLRVTFLSALVLEWIATISTAVVAVETGLRLLYGKMAFDEAFFILLLAPEFYQPLRNLAVRFHAGMSGVAATGRIFQILETPLQIHKPSVTHAFRLTDTGADIHFDNVHAAYEMGTRQALRGVSFQINAGDYAVLIGPSGSGKTTITHLLLRFISPDRGRILVGETALEAIDPHHWRSHIAWVPQNPYLFNTSITENIRIAKPHAQHRQIVNAAKQSFIHEFIESLPDGYDTLIGERGARLSAGQAQMIALARAFLKDAPILIFDEATSNLDVEHEAQIQTALKDLLQGRTGLLIAHRLSTIQEADNIIVLSRGRILEQGSHAALIRQEGTYQRMLRAYQGTV
jgi:ATP-binding cassette subfamily C protein CydD